MKNIILFLTVLFLTYVNAQSPKQDTFKETPAILKINNDHIFGTLTVPDGIKKCPVALIIAGSGPTDRDGNNSMMKNNSLKMLAEELAKNGIASLRFDKRGIGESKKSAVAESSLVFENYTEDVKSWINYLKQDKRFTQLTVIGHSEGSLIGMIASAKANKFVSIAGAGESADKLIKTQIASKSNKQIEDMTFPIIDSLKAGNKVNKVDPLLNSLFRASIQPYLISWFKYDPQTEIKKLTIPVLIIQGNNDLQVSVKDAENLSKAKPNSELVIVDKMNHIMKIIDGDQKANMESYNNETLPISETLVHKIVFFIKK
ncbi:alpha/beta hydrolase [Flavobacterium sp. WLB]|uniref:alpha/beta hydrolase n=1 Tax=unclassified Flavobacterium TaxID=196869 RepID=UPI0006ABDD92|nr:MULTISPECIES: alpha/beta fold hydrolase [unclassified Flavobacterium]KOP38572.1 alpha/beta hydrolase [Flavobacterium sp. VMW]OWU89866.1 alpha/beta hydrolase [Flavobacterium sp. NLM]PUU71860.1 alpha/beta hydrolase [Flavobacterium sp. WLB]